ncbi:MAG: hypothetical protein ACKVPJ_13490 [Chitinophagales bacterium]
MELSIEQLQEIEKWAGLWYNPDEICIAMGLSFEDMEIRFYDETDPVFQSYQKGKIITESKTRQKIQKLASDGSPSAQLLAHKYSNGQK